jgi:recombination protein RecT
VRQQPDQSKALTVVESKYQTVVDTLRQNNGADAKAIRAMLNGDKALMERFLAVTFSALAKNPNLLLNCTAVSIVQAVKDAASLGLDPTGLNGEGVILPYGDTAQFQPMWRGYVKRIRNSGKVVDIDCQIVFMNDDFRLELGTSPGVYHRPILVGEKDDEGLPTAVRGDYRGCYAWALMPSGKYIIEYLTTADINEVRDRYSKAFRGGKGDSPWDTAWPEMARKTAIKRLAKRLPGEAVDQLITVEARNDQAVEALSTAAAQMNDSLADVRKAAIAAATGEAAASATPEPETAPGTSEAVVGQAALIADAAAGDPGEQGEAEMMCRAPSPYGEGQFCVLFRGHATNHKSADKATWT